MHAIPAEEGGLFRSVMSQGMQRSQSFRSTCSRKIIDNLGFERVLSSNQVISDVVADADITFGGCASCLKFNSDGRRLATATSDCKVLVYDVKRGSCEQVLDGHSEIITGLAWVNESQSGSFYTSSLDKSIRLWKGYKIAAIYNDHADWIRCLGLSKDDRTLVSGCVSSNIFVRDTETGKTTSRLEAMQGLADMPDKRMSEQSKMFCTSFEYSVNALDFCHTNHNLFVSGVRDGTVRMWDIRDAKSGAISTLFAHDAKLNQVQLGMRDSTLLTSGRDSVIRLWDTRMMSETPSSRKQTLLMEFSGHKCSSYNISCTFFSNDRTVATGSEDNRIWIYDVESGKPIQTLSGHSAVVHFLATPSNNAPGLQLASSSIDSNRVKIWSANGKDAGDLTKSHSCKLDRVPSQDSRDSTSEVFQGGALSSGEFVNSSASGESLEIADAMEVDQMNTPSSANQDIEQMHRSAIETLMHKHGDLILRIFHTYDYSFRAPFDWHTLLRHIERISSAEGSEESSGDPVPSQEGGLREGSGTTGEPNA